MQLAPSFEYLLLTGGSGLYIDAFLNGIDQMPVPDPVLRKELMQMAETPGGLNELRMRLREMDPVTYGRIDLSNKRRVMRATEVCLLSGKPYHTFLKNTPKKRPFSTEVLLMERPREELYRRIDRRVLQMMEAGLEEEARGLYRYRKLPALQTVGYRGCLIILRQISFGGGGPADTAQYAQVCKASANLLRNVLEGRSSSPSSDPSLWAKQDDRQGSGAASIFSGAMRTSVYHLP